MVNSERLKYYFPITLALNTTLEKIKDILLLRQKVLEINEK